MVWVEWLSTLTSFAGTLMIARHIHPGWLLGVAADFGFVTFACEKKLWGFLTLCAGYLVLNLVGWFS